MRLVVRLRAVAVVVAMVVAGLSAVLFTAPTAGAAPFPPPPNQQQNCNIDVVRGAAAAAQSPGGNQLVLKPDFYSTGINTALSVPDPGVLKNDTLPEFYDAFVPEFGYPSYGDLYFPEARDEDGGGGFYYCPDRGFIGTDHFTYEVCNDTEVVNEAARPNDEDDSCQTVVVTITVGGGLGGCYSGFPDVPASNPFCPDVAYLTTYGFAKGYADGNFHPTVPVTRQAAAAVLQRFADSSVPACKSAPFPDVPVSSTFCAAIAYLVAHKVVAGFADGNFHPTSLVTREGIAAFLYKLANPGKAVPACTKAPFSDVPASSPFCGAITWLVSHGIADGNADGTFHPTGAVLRQELARFVHRLGGLGG